MADDQGTSAALAETVAAVTGLVAALIPGGAAVSGPVSLLLGAATKLLVAHAQGTVTPEMRDEAKQDTQSVIAQLEALETT
jgi:hypothetical protein